MKELLSRHRALFSWALLTLLLLGLVLLLLEPVRARGELYDRELLRDGRKLQQMRSVAAAREQLELRLADYRARDYGGLVYPASEEGGKVALDIQQRVSAAVKNAGAELRSVAPVNPQQRDGYLSVGVMARFGGPLPAVLGAMQQLELDAPLLVFESVTLTPQNPRAGVSGTQSVELQVSVSTFIPVGSEGQP